MNPFRFPALFGFALLASACANAPPSPVDTSRVDPALGSEQNARSNSTQQVGKAIAAKDTESLSALARTYREARTRTESGLWTIGLFHADVQFALTRGMARGTGCVTPNGSLANQWFRDDPQEPAAVITLAHYELRRAWCERGGGYADTVSQKEWDAFHSHAQRAYALLDANREMASVDPEFYTVMVNAYRAISASKAQLEALLDEAAAHEPYYMRPYFEAATSYLPQWGGSYNELDDFARYAAERTATSDKNGFYFRVYWSMENCGCAAPWNSGDWEMMKQAMRDVYDRYPSEHNVQHMIDVSCKAGDMDEALAFMWKKHPEATSDDDFVAMMATCDYLAQEERQRPTV